MAIVVWFTVGSRPLALHDLRARTLLAGHHRCPDRLRRRRHALRRRSSNCSSGSGIGDTDLITFLAAVPGTALGAAVVYWIGVAQGVEPESKGQEQIRFRAQPYRVEEALETRARDRT